MTLLRICRDERSGNFANFGQGNPGKVREFYLWNLLVTLLKYQTINTMNLDPGRNFKVLTHLVNYARMLTCENKRKSSCTLQVGFPLFYSIILQYVFSVSLMDTKKNTNYSFDIRLLMDCFQLDMIFSIFVFFGNRSRKIELGQKIFVESGWGLVGIVWSRQTGAGFPYLVITAPKYALISGWMKIGKWLRARWKRMVKEN